MASVGPAMPSLLGSTPQGFASGDAAKPRRAGGRLDPFPGASGSTAALLRGCPGLPPKGPGGLPVISRPNSARSRGRASTSMAAPVDGNLAAQAGGASARGRSAPEVSAAALPRAQSRGPSREGGERPKPRTLLDNLRALYVGEGADTPGEPPFRPDSSASFASGRSGSEAPVDEEDLQKQLQAMRTGDEAVAFLARHCSRNVGLVYCNRPRVLSGDLLPPYDLVVVSRELAQPEHFILSANGVVHVCPGELSEHTPLFDWMRQSSTYGLLVKMPFFMCFEHRKFFYRWRSNGRRDVYERSRQRLARGCLFAIPSFAKHFVQVHRVMQEIREEPLIVVRSGVHQLQDFIDAQTAVRTDFENGASARLHARGDAAVAALNQVSASGQHWLAQATGVAQNKAKEIRPGDAKRQEQERQRRIQLLRSTAAKVNDCIRAAEVMRQAAVLDMVVGSISTLQKRLGGPDPEKLFSVSAVAFRGDGGAGGTRRSLDGASTLGGVRLEPSSETFAGAALDLWEDAAHIADAMPPLPGHHLLQAQLPHGSMQRRPVSEILGSCRDYVDAVAAVDGLLRSHHKNAEAAASEMYDSYRRIAEFGCSWDEDAYTRKKRSSAETREQVELMRDFQADLDRFRPFKRAGIFVIDGSCLRSSLAVIPERALLAMTTYRCEEVRLFGGPD